LGLLGRPFGAVFFSCRQDFRARKSGPPRKAGPTTAPLQLRGTVEWVVMVARLKIEQWIGLVVVLFSAMALPCFGQDKQSPAPDPAGATKKVPAKEAAERALAAEQQDLQRSIEQAGNDRAAMVRNLEAFLTKYPETSQRPQIYRALVESSLQLRDFATATDYAERMVSLSPNDLSINMLSVQLLERYGDPAGWQRAVSYATRVLQIVQRESETEKSPRQSNEQFEKEKQRDESSILVVRGRLHEKLKEPKKAQEDFETSYRILPSAVAAEHLGELAELRKDLPTAIHEYALAFALADGSAGSPSRADLRKKLGNAWRLAHGSDDGLGDYVLHAYDEAAATSAATRPARNKGLKDPSEYVLRKAGDGAPFAMAETKGKVVVMNFWATWCGPCREWEPHFERIARHFAGRENEVEFLEVNCDEDEALVGPYLAEEKPRTAVLFADGLDVLLGVNSFPTTVILDHAGKIAYRAEGFDPDGVDGTVVDAIEKAIGGKGEEIGRRP
jgi:thiol-disulfide isomerase/thioredoxin